MWFGLPRRAELDPTGRLRVPRPSTLLRAAAVALLLVLAVVAWQSSRDPTHPDAGAPGRAATADLVADASAPARAASPTDAADAGSATSTADRGAPDTGPAPPARLPVPSGRVGVPVTLGSPAVAALLRPGDRVDLFTTSVDGGPVTVARGATVLEVAAPEAAVLLAVTAVEAEQVVAAGGARFTVVVRPEPG